MHLFRALDAKWSSSRLPRTFVTTAVAGAIAITAWVLIMASAPLAQQAPLLRACLSHNVVCAITANTKADIDKRLKEGWKMIRTGRGE